MDISYLTEEQAQQAMDQWGVLDPDRHLKYFGYQSNRMKMDRNKKALKFMDYALEFDAQRRRLPWWRFFKRRSLRKKSDSALELSWIYMKGYSDGRSDVERVGIF